MTNLSKAVHNLRTKKINQRIGLIPMSFIILLGVIFTSNLYAIDSRCPSPFGGQAKDKVLPVTGKVICLVSPEILNKYELFSALPVIKLSQPINNDRDVVKFNVTPNELLIAYTADVNTWTKYELYVTSVSGGQPQIKVSGTVLAHEAVSEDFFWATNDRLIFRKGRTSGLPNFVLESTTPTGIATKRLFPVAPFSGSVEPMFKLISDNRVRFQVNNLGVYSYWTNSIYGGDLNQEIFADGFESGGTTKWH